MLKSILKPIRYITSDDFWLRQRKWRTEFMAKSSLGRHILRKQFNTPAEYLESEAFGMKFSSPIGLAAGFDTNGTMIDAMEATGFGFVEIGSITPLPQNKGSFPQLHKLPKDRALLYNAEIESVGVEQVIENIKSHNSRIIIGCNITKGCDTSNEDAPMDYLRLFRPLYQYADYFSVNICCNSSDDVYVPTHRDEIMAILTPLFEFRRGQSEFRPILLKISPDLTDSQLDTITSIMADTPLDGIIACGGTTGRYNLDRSAVQMHSLGRTPGIISGQPLKQRALEVVRYIYSHSKGAYPIIGCGGISTPDDAMAMLNAGATLLQVGSEYIYGGGDSIRLLREGLNDRLRKQQRSSTEEPRQKI